MLDKQKQFQEVRLGSSSISNQKASTELETKDEK